MAKQKPKTPDDKALPGVSAVAEAATNVAAAAADEATASEPLAGDEPAADEPAPDEPAPAPVADDGPHAQRVDLVLKLDIALGNGNRAKGHRLGAFHCAMGLTIAEALALAADSQADCIVQEPHDVGFYPVVTRGPATVADRAFPPGSHVGNFEIPPKSDTLRSEALQALRNYSVICS